jgi:hypothetical protein
MHEKLERLNSLVKEVKAKIEKVSRLNVQAKELNYKLEAFLFALNAYSCYDRTDRQVSSDSSLSMDLEPMGIDSSRMGVLSDIDLSRSVRMDSPMMKVRSTPNRKRVALFDEILSEAMKVVPDNRMLVSCTEKIIKLLYGKREGLLLDEIIKEAGVNKYRCIDVLNMLIKADPQIIYKKFDKGFIYVLNHELQK